MAKQLMACVQTAVATRVAPWGAEEFLGTKLSRAGALSHPLKQEVFEILDELVADEPRFRAFLEGRFPA
jgi:hypothetical protein